MDKNTLSNYGWIIVTTIIIALMIVLATPFGSYIGDAFTSVVDGFSEKVAEGTNGAITVSGMGSGSNGETGSETNGITVVPENCTYTPFGLTTLNPGETLPEISTGDIFIDNDYEYRYNYSWGGVWTETPSLNGWSVHVLDDTKTTYGTILTSINGKPVLNLTGVFYNCTNMTIAPGIPSSATSIESAYAGCSNLVSVPTIPDGVTSIRGAYFDCVKLTIAPTIPSSVTDINSAFAGCSLLSGSVTINCNPEHYDYCLYGTQITEVTGSTTLKTEILGTK